MEQVKVAKDSGHKHRTKTTAAWMEADPRRFF